MNFESRKQGILLHLSTEMIHIVIYSLEYKIIDGTNPFYLIFEIFLLKGNEYTKINKSILIFGLN